MSPGFSWPRRSLRRIFREHVIFISRQFHHPFSCASAAHEGLADFSFWLLLLFQSITEKIANRNPDGWKVSFCGKIKQLNLPGQADSFYLCRAKGQAAETKTAGRHLPLFHPPLPPQREAGGKNDFTTKRGSPRLEKRNRRLLGRDECPFAQTWDLWAIGKTPFPRTN